MQSETYLIVHLSGFLRPISYNQYDSPVLMGCNLRRHDLQDLIRSSSQSYHVENSLSHRSHLQKLRDLDRGFRLRLSFPENRSRPRGTGHAVQGDEGGIFTL
jgi:hypothetical protein